MWGVQQCIRGDGKVGGDTSAGCVGLDDSGRPPAAKQCIRTRGTSGRKWRLRGLDG